MSDKKEKNAFLKFLAFIFTIRNEGASHKILTVLGLKIKFKKRKYWFRNFYISKFYKHKVSPDTVLLCELNTIAHRETLIGYWKYLEDLGYKVEVLFVDSNENIFCREKYTPNEIIFYEEELPVIFDKFDFSKYSRIIYNSKIIYFGKLYWSDIHTAYPNLPKGQKDNIYIQHHIERIGEFPEDKQIILANPAHKPELDALVVNPHYFGEIKQTAKNKVVNFITVGELSPQRRNCNLLLNAVEKLAEKGIMNFKITVVGMGELKELPIRIKKYFDIKGRLDYAKMFNEVEKADYFLPLLDPELELHKRYMTSGTSGSFQLVYGFTKPCLIHKTFADIYDFSEKNSIIYEQNEDLAEKMEEAINLQGNKYLQMCAELEKCAKRIEEISIKNFKGVLDE